MRKWTAEGDKVRREDNKVLTEFEGVDTKEDEVVAEGDNVHWEEDGEVKTGVEEVIRKKEKYRQIRKR